MGGAAAKRRGYNYELELKKLLQGLGYEAERVYASGALGTRFGPAFNQNLEGDLTVEVPAPVMLSRAGINERRLLKIEVKYRSKEFPAWLKAISEPSRGTFLDYYPGYDVLAATLYDFRDAPELGRNDARFHAFIKGTDVLAMRFPKKNRSDTGWLLAVPRRHE